MGGHDTRKRKKNKKRNDNEENQLQGPVDDHEISEESVAVKHEHPHADGKSQERHLSEDDSESENEPKKKKKKKKVLPDVSTDKKNVKSIRQMKKEKYAQRQAEKEAASKDQLKSECLSYLSQWKHNRVDWKFMKVKQGWLYKNKFSQNLVPNDAWPLLMEYFESAKGNIRNLLLEDAKKVIKQMDDWTETQNEEKSAEDGVEEESECIKPDDTVYKRARDLIQCLQE